jgi:hypothetical protein
LSGFQDVGGIGHFLRFPIGNTVGWSAESLDRKRIKLCLISF